jgi:uroporphyrinogen decarboxylase
MTPKARVQHAIAFQGPDRVPVGEFGIDFEMVARVVGRPSLYRGRFLEDQALAEGRWAELAEDYCVDLEAVSDAFGWDLLVLTLLPSKDRTYLPWQPTNDGLYTHGDGLFFARTPQNWMLAVRDERPRTNPVPALESIVYHEPNLPDESCFTAIDYHIERRKDTHYLALRLPIGIDYPMFGHSHEEGLMNLLAEEETVDRWMAVQSDQAVALTRKVLDRCPQVDAVLVGVDYSHNGGPLVSPALFRRWVLPGLRAVVDEAHRRGKAVIQHACGNNWPLLDMFVEAGIDVYQSIQPSASMDMRLLKAAYDGRLALWGGVSVESVISGTPDDVRRETRYALRHAAPGGGFIAGVSHSVGVGTQYDNYQAMLETLRTHGGYPISVPE